MTPESRQGQEVLIFHGEPVAVGRVREELGVSMERFEQTVLPRLYSPIAQSYMYSYMGRFARVIGGLQVKDLQRMYTAWRKAGIIPGQPPSGASRRGNTLAEYREDDSRAILALAWVSVHTQAPHEPVALATYTQEILGPGPIADCIRIPEHQGGSPTDDQEDEDQPTLENEEPEGQVVVLTKEQIRQRRLGLIAGAQPNMLTMLERFIPVVEAEYRWPMRYTRALEVVGRLFNFDDATRREVGSFLQRKQVIQGVTSEPIVRKGPAELTITEEGFFGMFAVARMVLFAKKDTPEDPIPWKGEHVGKGIIAKTIVRLGESPLATEALADPYALPFTQEQLQRIRVGRINELLEDKLVVWYLRFMDMNFPPPNQFRQFAGVARTSLLNYAQPQRADEL